MAATLGGDPLIVRDVSPILSDADYSGTVPRCNAITAHQHLADVLYVDYPAGLRWDFIPS
jgi:hypothetical protein